MRVLFLDCDGVLNSRDDYMVSGDQRPYYVLNRKKVDYLLDIIKETNCKIVLSSSWRVMQDGRETLEEHDIPIFDVTENLSGCRGSEIQEWLDRHPETTGYAIVDDDSDMLLHQLPHFVHTDFLIGMNETIAYRVARRLEMPMSKSLKHIFAEVDNMEEAYDILKNQCRVE